MHEITRRTLCRMLFVLLCLLPTLGVCGWAYVRSSPRYAIALRTEWETELASRLGLRVTLENVRQPKLQRTLLERVKLLDPETSAVIATLRVVEINHSPLGVLIEASQPEIDARYLPRLAELLHDRLLRGPTRPDFHIHFLAADLTLQDERNPRTFTDVEGLVEATDEGPRAAIHFRLAGMEMATPAQFRARRLRGDATATLWELHTPSAALPCSLFAPFLPPLTHLGPAATFRGSVWGSQLPDGWRGQLNGRLAEVDLSRLVSEHFPHKLSGFAEVLLQEATFQHDRIDRFVGSIHCRDGVIGTSLLESMATELQIAFPGKALGQSLAHWHYTELGLGAELDNRGLVLSGLCEGPKPGAIVLSKHGPLLSQSKRQWAPVVSLVRALTPPNEVQAPITRASEQLLRSLPLPVLASDSGTLDKHPVPVRLSAGR